MPISGRPELLRSGFHPGDALTVGRPDIMARGGEQICIRVDGDDVVEALFESFDHEAGARTEIETAGYQLLTLGLGFGG